MKVQLGTWEASQECTEERSSKGTFGANGEPYAGKLHVRFDEGYPQSRRRVAKRCTSRGAGVPDEGRLALLHQFHGESISRRRGGSMDFLMESGFMHWMSERMSFTNWVKADLHETSRITLKFSAPPREVNPHSPTSHRPLSGHLFFRNDILR